MHISKQKYTTSHTKYKGNKPRRDRQADCLFPASTFTSANPAALCACILCVDMWVCLSRFVRKYAHVWVNANGRAAWPGIKTAVQTGGGPGGVRVSLVKIQTGWNESEERSWCHAASSSLKHRSRASTPGMKTYKSTEMVDNRGQGFREFSFHMTKINACPGLMCCEISSTVLLPMRKRGPGYETVVTHYNS